MRVPWRRRRASEPEPELSPEMSEALQELAEVAESTGLRPLTHIGDTPENVRVVIDLLRTLGSGSRGQDGAPTIDLSD